MESSWPAGTAGPPRGWRTCVLRLQGPGALIAQDGGEQALGVGAAQGVGVGVADAGGLHFHQHLAVARAGQVDGFDGERCAGLPGDGSLDLPGKVLRRMGGRAAQARATARLAACCQSLPPWAASSSRQASTSLTTCASLDAWAHCTMAGQGSSGTGGRGFRQAATSAVAQACQNQRSAASAASPASANSPYAPTCPTSS